ncbi:MAG: hypothetical protein U0521_04485 [Anaerolineae bacterium]
MIVDAFRHRQRRRTTDALVHARGVDRVMARRKRRLLRNTYRYHGHHQEHANQGLLLPPRPKKKTGKRSGSVSALLTEWMIADLIIDPAMIERIEQQDVRAEAQQAVEFALNAPCPDLSEVSQMKRVE